MSIPTRYAITATVETSTTDAHGATWTRIRQVPTFFLDADVQGIRDEEGAANVARRILGVEGDGATVHVCAVALD